MPRINSAPCPMKITFIYNSMLNFIPVLFCTAYIFVTFRVRVRVSFRVRVKVRVRVWVGDR